MEKDIEIQSFKRGDTFAFCIPIESETEITINDVETLFCTCRLLPVKTSPIIFEKTLDNIKIDNEGVHIVINPEDTQELEYGKYYFDIELTLKNNYRVTYTGIFNLLYETSFHTKEGVVNE